MELAMLSSVFVMSFLGSLHCVGMCGGFVALSVLSHDPKSASPRKRSWGLVSWHLRYHLGRLLSYLSLGVVGGAAGYLIGAASSFLRLQTVAAVCLGSILIGLGLARLFAFTPASGHSGQASSSRLPSLRRALSGGVLSRLYLAGGAASPLMIGLFSVLLPCGWLYTYVLLAVASASPVAGLGVMTAFWLGSVPALVGAGAALSGLMTRFPALSHRASGALIVLVGVLTMLGKFAAPHGADHHTMHAPPAAVTSGRTP